MEIYTNLFLFIYFVFFQTTTRQNPDKQGLKKMTVSFSINVKKHTARLSNSSVKFSADAIIEVRTNTVENMLTLKGILSKLTKLST